MPYHYNQTLRNQVCQGVAGGLNNTEIAIQYGVSRERVRQIREKLGLSRIKCACGTKLVGKKSIDTGVCGLCKRIANPFCIICKERRVYKQDEDRCWRCRRSDFNHSDEGRAYQAERAREYLKSVNQDPERKAHRKLKVAEWNKRAKEKKRAKGGEG